MSQAEDFLRINRQQNVSTYLARIKSLKQEGMHVDHIERGVEECNRVMSDGAKSFVIYGEPQAGKTETMIALTCSLIDNGYRTIFIIMNDNVQLENQNYERFLSVTELNPSPKTASQIVAEDPKNLKKDLPRVIFCRKNAANLENLIEACRFMKKRVVIDDEADYASPNAKINKKEQTKINEMVESLIDAKKGGIYIGVTATPGRLDLNNTFANEAKDWVFIDSYPTYKGRSFFFPTTPRQIAQSDYILTKLPEEGEAREKMQRVIYRFLIRVAYLNVSKEPRNYQNFSMLIHTGGRKNDHQKDKQIVEEIISKLRDLKEDLLEKKAASRLIDKFLGEMDSMKLDVTKEESYDILNFIIKFIGKSEILIINSDKREDENLVSRACDPVSLFTFAIGGNIVSRGLTFKNLLTFFFSRTVKGKLQQNTYIQRARMFGNRNYTKHFELAIPSTLFEDWAEAFSDHEESLLTAKAGEYVHYKGKKSSPSDSASIDKKNVMSFGKGASEVMAGDIFNYSDKTVETILSGKDTPMKTLEKIADMEESSIPVKRALLEHIKSLLDNDESQCTFLLNPDGEIYSIVGDDGEGRMSGANIENISRDRGGIIAALIQGIKRYDSFKIIFLPFKNDTGQMRFYVYVRRTEAKTILINVLNKNKTIRR